MFTNRRVVMGTGSFLAAWLFAGSLSFGLLQTVDLQQGGPVPTFGTTDFYFNVAGAGSVLDHLQVRLAIQDISTSSLGISLIHGGKQVTLFSNDGGFFDQNLQNTLFDDAGSSLTTGTAPFTGTFRPDSGTLSSFYGGDPNGLWSLQVTNTILDASGWVYSKNDLSPPTPPWYPSQIYTQLLIISNTPGSVTAVPEPLSAGLSLAGLGVLGLRLLGRRRVG